MGVMSLGKRYGNDRLEAACERALFIRGVNYKSLKSMLENNRDKKPLQQRQEPAPVNHENIRGTGYYH